MTSFSGQSKAILICTGIFPPDIGGPATYTVKIAGALKNLGFRVSVITYTDQLLSPEKASYPLYGIKRSSTLSNYLRYFLKVLTAGRESGTLYILDTFSAALPSVVANIFLRKKLVIRVGGLFSWEQSYLHGWTGMDFEKFYTCHSSFLAELLKKTELWIINQAVLVITNSNFMKKVIVKAGVDKKKIHVIFNSYEATSVKINERVKLKNLHKLRLLSAGRLVPWKNFDKLILAVKDLDQANLVIAGDGPLKRSCEDLITKYGLKDRVALIGRVSHPKMLSLYTQSDIFVLLSSFEGMSHQLLEAMFLNLPIIASDIEPNREALADYHYCEFVPCDRLTPVTFKRAVVKLSLKNRIKSPPHQKLFSRFNSTYVINQTLKLL